MLNLVNRKWNFSIAGMVYLLLYANAIISITKLKRLMIASNLIKVPVVHEVLLPLQCSVRPLDAYGRPRKTIINLKMEWRTCNTLNLNLQMQMNKRVISSQNLWSISNRLKNKDVTSHGKKLSVLYLKAVKKRKRSKLSALTLQ